MDIVQPHSPVVDSPAVDSSEATGATVALNSYSGGVSPAERTEAPPRRSTRTRRTDRPHAPGSVGHTAPLVRPDGTPAPVVHLVPELSPYARECLGLREIQQLQRSSCSCVYRDDLVVALYKIGGLIAILD